MGMAGHLAVASSVNIPRFCFHPIGRFDGWGGEILPILIGYFEINMRRE